MIEKVSKQRRGSPESRDGLGCSRLGQPALRFWRDKNKKDGISNHRRRELMRDDAATFIFEDFAPELADDWEKVRSMMDRPASRYGVSNSYLSIQKFRQNWHFFWS